MLIIAGPRDYSYWKNLTRLADKLNVNDYIVWKEAMIGDEKYNPMLNCTFFVHPSVSDVTPVTLIEAQALGRPIVSTKVGLIPEIVKDKKTGILVQPKIPLSLLMQLNGLF